MAPQSGAASGSRESMGAHPGLLIICQQRAFSAAARLQYIILRNKRGGKHLQKTSCNASEQGSEVMNGGVLDGRVLAPQTSDNEAWSGTASGSHNRRLQPWRLHTGAFHSILLLMSLMCA